jgi:hypothetical protein
VLYSKYTGRKSQILDTMSHDYDPIDESDEVRLESSPVKKRKLTVDERTIKK